MHHPLPADWQEFFTYLGPGAAVFGLFELGERGEQPVLLIHVAPDMQIPAHPAVQSTLEWHQDVGVVRIVVAMQPNAPRIDALTLSVRDLPRREAYQLSIQHTSEPLRFETFLNPTNAEDRAILQKLAETSALSISLVQRDQALWGKQFPWSQSIREVVNIVLAQTQIASSLDPVTWEQAKAHVMKLFPL